MALLTGWETLLETLDQVNPFVTVDPKVWCEHGDDVEREEVMKAMLQHQQDIDTAKVGYLVVLWRKQQGQNVTRALFCRDPPDETESNLHSKLSELFTAPAARKEIPVVVVDPSVRRKHCYTYLVSALPPWREQPTQNTTSKPKKKR